jgi:DNA-directed RNA polymerase subunit RPC12/RpoP
MMLNFTIEHLARVAADLRQTEDPRDCPRCGGRLFVTEATTLDVFAPTYHTKGHPLPTVERPTIVAACTACEYVAELMTEVR